MNNFRASDNLSLLIWRWPHRTHAYIAVRSGVIVRGKLKREGLLSEKWRELASPSSSCSQSHCSLFRRPRMRRQTPPSTSSWWRNRRASSWRPSTSKPSLLSLAGRYFLPFMRPLLSTLCSRLKNRGWILDCDVIWDFLVLTLEARRLRRMPWSIVTSLPHMVSLPASPKNRHSRSQVSYLFYKLWELIKRKRMPVDLMVWRGGFVFFPHFLLLNLFNHCNHHFFSFFLKFCA